MDAFTNALTFCTQKFMLIAAMPKADYRFMIIITYIVYYPALYYEII